MFTEKSRLSGKRENPFYGSYQEKSANDGLQFKSQQKRRQLAIVTAVILALTLLAIGIVIAVTLPPLVEINSNKALNPLDPISLTINSSSVLRGPYDNGGVSSDDTICSEIGKTILETRKGSVVDSAVAVALCLGVVAPQTSGLGGGFFMTVYIDRKMYSLNAAEKIPAGVTNDAYLNDPLAMRTGGLAVAIPSELAGLFAAHQKFGKLKWAEIVKPARDLAQNGFRISQELGKTLKLYDAHISKDAVLRSEFFNATSGKPWVEGDKITRPRLSHTLEKLENAGTNDFYNGTIASQIVEEINGAGGIFSQADLSNYRVQWVESIIYELRNNLTLVSPPFPSSGPIVGMSLGVLQGYGRKDPSQFNAKENGVDIHRLVETLKFAHAHRSQVADPSFSNDSLTLLQEKLLSPDYATELRANIFDYKTFANPAYYGARYVDALDSGATQISIIGPNGDAVSLTTSINSPFGAGFMGNLTGIIYNNQIAGFSIISQTDTHGRGANPYNYVEPGKQAGSSMAPLIFLNATGSPVFATGSSGGLNSLSAIISTTWRALYRDMDIKSATDYPRISPRFSPSQLQYEYGVPASVIDDLHRKGHQTHRISMDSYLGNVNSVCRTKRTTKILGNADYRKHGEAVGF